MGLVLLHSSYLLVSCVCSSFISSYW